MSFYMHISEDALCMHSTHHKTIKLLQIYLCAASLSYTRMLIIL